MRYLLYTQMLIFYTVKMQFPFLTRHEWARLLTFYFLPSVNHRRLILKPRCIMEHNWVTAVSYASPFVSFRSIPWHREHHYYLLNPSQIPPYVSLCRCQARINREASQITHSNIPLKSVFTVFPFPLLTLTFKSSFMLESLAPYA